MHYFRLVRRLCLSFFSLALLVGACASEIGGPGPGPSCEDGSCDEAPRAFCSVTVVGKGTKDVELDYLPNVIACESGNASLEALKAQAIAARSFVYYKLARGESIRDSQGDQVYSCGKTPTALHRQAVEDTSGLFLRYRGTNVAAFFVAGALQSSSTCTGGTNDEFNTERFVTYNQGLSGSDIEQSRLGLRDPNNFANRGCMSQNGADCLSNQGKSAQEIINFYYGSDIEVTRASGACIVPGADIGGGGEIPPSGASIGDDCTFDASVCDFEGGGASGECLDWFDGNTQELHGFCSLDCEGSCAIGSGFGQTYCAELDPGQGDCVVVPSEDNGFCEDIEGTLIQVVERHVGASGLSAEWKGVCVPPGNATQCSSDVGQPGECIDTDTMACGGTIHVGQCPGGNNIRCCTQ